MTMRWSSAWAEVHLVANGRGYVTAGREAKLCHA
jgi:hypothetical protein